MQKKFVQLQNKLGKSYLPVVFVFFSLLLLLILYPSVKPHVLDVQLYQVAEQTIRANTTVEDKERTEANQKIAADSVEPVYTFNSELEKNQTTKIELLFAAVNEVKQTKKNSEITVPGTKGDPDQKAAEERIQLFAEKLYHLDEPTQDFISRLPEWAISDLLNASLDDLELLEHSLIEIVSEKMSQPIKKEQLETTIDEAKNNIQYTALNGTYQRIANLLLDHAIVENQLYDEQETEQQRQVAIKRVQPVMILQGQVVVQEGHVIDSGDMHQLKLLGMLENKASYQLLISLLVLLFVQSVHLLFVTRSENDLFLKRNRDITFYYVLVIFGLILMKGLQLISKADVQYVEWLYPAALAPLLITTLSSRRYGFLANSHLAALSIYLFHETNGVNSGLTILLFYFLSGLLGTLHSNKQRFSFSNKNLLRFIFADALLMIALVFYMNQPFVSFDTGIMVLFAMIGGMLAYLLALLFFPYAEVLQTDSSALKLLELSNPNQPLLQLLLTQAPGTYHHSLMVANLSSATAGAIGLDPLFARVACYYHDVGKLTHPLFFVENVPTGMKNPHDLLSPEESRNMIFSHVTEGVRMLEEADFPTDLIDICAQHHGTTLMKYFYIEAKKENEDVKEVDFRYAGPKPQTKAAAIIHIADSAEAACRSMEGPTKDKIKHFVHHLINDRIEDGQFDECPLTIKELKKIETSLVNNLIGTFHSRIEYPELKKEDREK